MDSSDFYRILLSRSSVRSYTHEPLTDEEIRTILECAVTAPSAGNLESWDVVAVLDLETKEMLAEACYGQEHVEKAAMLFVVCANYIRSMSRYGERGILYAVQDATIACTYMMLAVHTLGLVSCWTGAFDEAAVRECLSLPSHIRPVAILATGHGSLPSTQTERMTPGEHLHWNSW